VDDAVDGGAADTVFLGEVGQGHFAGGVAPTDGALCGFGEFGLLALQLAFAGSSDLSVVEVRGVA
jgi:hypothetical protein